MATLIGKENHAAHRSRTDLLLYCLSSSQTWRGAGQGGVLGAFMTANEFWGVGSRNPQVYTSQGKKKDTEVSVCSLMLPYGAGIYSAAELGQRERTPSVHSLYKLSGKKWNIKHRYRKRMLLCITDASCEDLHRLFFFSFLLFNSTPTSLWFYFISIPEDFIFLLFVCLI